jgi:hypothetical protein
MSKDDRVLFTFGDKLGGDQSPTPTPEPLAPVPESNQKFVPKRMSIREFREFGFLQEANRLFFHPLGIGLEVIVDYEGVERLGGIWDYRHLPDGMCYSTHQIEQDEIDRVEKLFNSKKENRIALWGTPYQQIDKEDGNV